MNLRDVLHQTAHTADELTDTLIHAIRQRVGVMGPVRVVPYVGYGTRRRVRLMGRVLLDRKAERDLTNASSLDNLIHMMGLYATNEVAGAKVRATFPDGQTVELETDEEGYLDAWVTLDTPVAPDAFWRRVSFELLDPIYDGQQTTTFSTRVQVPGDRAEFGVISDIDDTILQTGAQDLLRTARIVLLNNANSRLPFPGVDVLYNALRKSDLGTPRNPFWYLSSSPWNLYELFERFMQLHNLPPGPMLLKDFGVDEDTFIKSSHAQHKTERILGLLDRYPNMSFVLIGDSGQQDTEIYHDVARRHGRRIRAIYIRDVTGDDRDAEVEQMGDELREWGVPLVLAEDSAAIARHAAAEGLISELSAEQVERACQSDAEPHLAIA